MLISRRNALFGTVAGGLAGCATSFDHASFQGLTPVKNASFAHGVASGDPANDSVVLWTRVSTTSPRLPVTIEIATDKKFVKLVQSHLVETSGASDHTVKFVAEGLEPGATYYYRFLAGGEYSPIGRTKTLPLDARRAKFAVASCSNYPFGYFNAYDHMARQDVDAVIHLGDYIYEYGTGGYGSEVGEKLGRNHTPTHEILSIEDYRQRHAQYKSDPGAQAMHAAHPFIAIWDDHETSNDSFKLGAENHDPETEGSWDERRNAALQAYYEWMPIRDPEPGKLRESLYKSYSWGKLLTLASIETRLTARTKQLQYDEVVPTLQTPEDIEQFRQNVLGSDDRYLIGDAQMQYLEETLKSSVARDDTWRVVANQVIMARIIAPNLAPYASEEMIAEIEPQFAQIREFIQFTTLGLPLNLDAWDGYPAARERFYNMAKNVGASDLIVLTGDTHEAWGNDLYNDAGDRMGVELGATGVTSPAPTKVLGDGAGDYSLLMRKENRDIRFHDPMNNGYFTLTLDEDQGEVDFIGLSTVKSRTYDAFVAARFDLVKKNGTVEFDSPKGLGFKERVVY